MPLDGLRAWIGEVEHKLGMRTRVFLVLATIAIGGAGAAIYLAIDTRDDAVSESDVQELQERLEAGGAVGATGADPRVAQLEGELEALEAEVERLEGGGQGGAGGGGASGGGSGSGADGGVSGGAADGGTGGGISGGDSGSDGGSLGSGIGSPEDKAKLQDLLEQAEKQSDGG